MHWYAVGYFMVRVSVMQKNFSELKFIGNLVQVYWELSFLIIVSCFHGYVLILSLS